MFEPDFIYTTDEIAKLLRVHPQTVKRWLRAGDMRGALIADRTGWRVLGRDLQAFWDERLNKSASTFHEHEEFTERKK
jgi:excisionase family DNA binding protein